MYVYWYLNTVVVILTKLDVSRIKNLTMGIDGVTGVSRDDIIKTVRK